MPTLSGQTVPDCMWIGQRACGAGAGLCDAHVRMRGSAGMALRSPFIQLSQQFARRGARNWGWYYRAKMELENPVDTRPKLDLLQNPVGPRAKAFLDVKLGDSQPRRIVVELAVRGGYRGRARVRRCAQPGVLAQSDIVPRTVENFLKVRRGACLLAPHAVH